MDVRIYESRCHPVENDNFLYRRVELDHETEVTVHTDYTVKECVCVCACVWSIVLRGDGSHQEGRLLSGQNALIFPVSINLRGGSCA